MTLMNFRLQISNLQSTRSLVGGFLLMLAAVLWPLASAPAATTNVQFTLAITNTVPLTNASGATITLNGNTVTWTNASVSSLLLNSRLVAATNTPAKALTNLFTKLQRGFTNQLTISYASSTSLVASAYLQDTLSANVSTGWATLTFTTNSYTTANSTGTVGLSNLTVKTITLNGTTITDWAEAGGGESAPRVVYVRTNGNNLTAAKYDAANPYATIVAGAAVIVPGDILDVGPGTVSGTITNVGDAEYRFSSATIWSNPTPQSLIRMNTAGNVNFTGLGKWYADTVFDTTPLGITNLTGSLSAAEIHPITDPNGYALLIQDGFDNVSDFVTNGSARIALTVNAGQAELAVYSHIFSAAPLARSVCTNASFTFNVDRLKVNFGDEAATNWTVNINSKDYCIPYITGGSARFVVNGGKLIATNTWAHDPVGFSANTLLMNGPVLIGNQLPPNDYYFGTWRTTTGDTNLITKARQFVGINYGALSFANLGSPQTIGADAAPMVMTNYSRIITNGFYGSRTAGVLTNQNDGVFGAAFQATGLASATETKFTVFTNNVATDIVGVLPALAGNISVSAVGIMEVLAGTQWKLVLDGDSVAVASVTLTVWRIK